MRTTRALWRVLLASTLSLAPGLHAQASDSTTQALLEKAHSLELRGRMDMAAQTWQQVLLADPNNTEALAGLARSAKFSGNAALAATYLDRLRTINPNDPNIARVESMGSQASQNTKLQQAGKLAAAGQYQQAMTIYRQVFGDNPPQGEWALAYYETEAATEDGRPAAIAGLRALIDKHPEDSRYQVALGRILTYNPHTRAEGRRYLERHPNDPQAVEALRQSLIWDSASPASAPEIRAYLQKHNDPELAQALRNQPKVSTRVPLTPEELAQNESTRAQNSQEAAAYAALNGHNLGEAETRFRAILADDPNNARALAGLGYVRMQQSNFEGAITFLEAAKQNGARDTGLDTALESAHFYSVMQQGAAALNENDLTTAEQQYRSALALRPSSTEALEGLGGTLLKAQQADAAIDVFERMIKAKPSSSPAWRGLFMAQYQAGNAPAALATERRIPPAVHSQLMRDPDFLRTLASAYSAVGRDADAQRVLHSALELPFPPGARGLQIETQLQYAALLQQANHLDQAAALFKQVLQADLSNTAAWQGLIRVQHALKEDPQAVQALSAMPPSCYDTAMRDPGFQITVAAIYQSNNHLDTAQDILEKAIAQQTGADQKPSIPVLLQLAGIYLQRNDPQHAYPIYRSILADSPDRLDAWKGLISSLHASGRDQEALAQIQQIPPAVRKQLESDVDYLQSVGSIYNALGQPQQAMIFLQRVQQHYTAQRTAAPADVDIQDAWLLFNAGNDTGLYRQLMNLGERPDLTDEQRRAIQTIWANWAVRRANQAAAGDYKRSLAILNAAAHSFPDNPGVLRALASGYARADLPRQSVAIFKSQDMSAATASDYKSAVGAALASNDMKDAETWLRFGLDSYPKDAGMLTLAAKFEQARGNSNRAADYYRASLAALPPADPGAELASELSQPAPATRLPRASQPQDLATLLSTPDTSNTDANAPAEPQHPYLPSYTNSYGQAPVTIPGSSSNVVPSYMANPAARPQSRPETLGNYAPQAYAKPAPAATPDIYSAYVPSAQDAQRLQIQRLTDQAEAAPLPAPAYQTQTSSNLPLTTQPNGQGEIYGPYVPYRGQAPASGYTPTPVPVQLGDNTPHAARPDTEITDVLPTARYLPNGQNNQGRTHVLAGQSNPPSDPALTTSNAQYTQQPQPQNDGYGQQYPQPGTYSTATTTHHRTTAAHTTTKTTPQPALNYPPVAQPLGNSPYPEPGPPADQAAPPTDADLMSRNLPPLRGSYNPADPNSGIVPPGTQRQQNEQDLSNLEASYSGWLGGTAYGRYRSGTPGFDRLTDIEAPFEASGVLGKSLRATIVARPVFLESGEIDTTTFQNSTGTVPVLGTLPGNALVQPAQQYSSGIGGEFQLTTTNFGAAVGYTPYEFLVANFTARVQWRPAGGPFTLFGMRDSVKDTQLSYAGLRDPGSSQGNIWGGVMATGGGVTFSSGGAKNGLYITVDGADLTGYHVLENRKYEGIMGAYFQVARWPAYGSLKIGASFFGMHYDYNERGMTYGQGGYFSPNIYFLAGVPVTWNGYYNKNLHYTIFGGIGVQTFQEDKAPYYPLDLPLQTSSGNAYTPTNSNTGLNYLINSQISYHVADRWFVGGFLNANNTNDYNTVSGGFFVRFLFKTQNPTDDYPTGLFPTDGFRALRVP